MTMRRSSQSGPPTAAAVGAGAAGATAAGGGSQTERSPLVTPRAASLSHLILLLCDLSIYPLLSAGWGMDRLAGPYIVFPVGVK